MRMSVTSMWAMRMAAICILSKRVMETLGTHTVITVWPMP
jgi:hypothetical protein